MPIQTLVQAEAIDYCTPQGAIYSTVNVYDNRKVGRVRYETKLYKSDWDSTVSSESTQEAVFPPWSMIATHSY